MRVHVDAYANADACIVGAGIASLYSAYKLRKARGPDYKIVMLEREDYVGGRVKMAPFAGKEIIEGAGVGRWAKDKLLRKLLKELGISVHRFRTLRHPKNDTIIRSALVDLRKASINTDVRPTFREFALQVLGHVRYEAFVNATGYTDYENADYQSALDYYGFDDTIGGRDLFYVPWKALIDALVVAIGATIHVGCSVKSIAKSGSTGYIVSSTHMTVHAPLIIVGVTANALRRLFSKVQVYNHVQSQPFIRIYARFQHGVALDALHAAINGHTVVNAPLQKIIPISTDVFMVAYADNNSAVALKKVGPRKLENLLRDSTGVSGLRILETHVKYWKIGTHYFSPAAVPVSEWIELAQKPLGADENVWVVGEAVSFDNQGWVEGALRSVKSVKCLGNDV